MYQTGYLGVTTFSSMLSFTGGMCEWYYTPKENIETWPAIDPATQYLITEPALKAGKTWFGPVKVPDTQLGFTEEQQFGKAGIFYKQKVSGFYPGDSGSSRVNLENMPYHEYVVVGKMRAGGLFIVLGDKDFGMSFMHAHKSGEGGKATAGAEFSFAAESLNKGIILPTFLGINVTPPPDSGIPAGNGAVTGQEDIFFENETEVTIPWTPERKANLGTFPTIQVWFTDEVPPAIARVPILVDAAPPDNTVFTVQMSGPSTGFIHLSK